MGLFSSITNEAKRNFVARPDTARADIIYKYPEHNIRMMTQLTCQPDHVESQVVRLLGVQVEEQPSKERVNTHNKNFNAMAQRGRVAKPFTILVS